LDGDLAAEVPRSGDAVSGPREREGSVVYSDGHLLVMRTTEPAGMMIAGEIDHSNTSTLANSIRLGFKDGVQPHLDLSRVSFADVSGIRALVNLALELSPGRCLLLHGLPPQLEEVLKVTSWADLPGLELCNCGIEL